MTEEEVEIVAEELAKVGGLSWHPGRPRGPFLRAVSNRYRDRARVMIAALERLRAGKQDVTVQQDPAIGGPEGSASFSLDIDEPLRVGATVVYRPPGDMRAVTCRVEKLEDGRAYLVPCPRPDIGWVSLDDYSRLNTDDIQAA